MSEQQGGSDAERTEEASPKRRKQFRDRGEVAKSQELTSAIMLAASAVALLVTVRMAQSRFIGVLHGGLGNLDARETILARLSDFLEQRMLDLGLLLAPGAFVLCLAAVAAHMLQTGPVFTLKAVAFKGDRLNPAKGIKRLLFSVETIANLIKTLAKVALIGTVAGMTVLSISGELPGLIAESPAELGRYLVKIAALPFFAGSAVMLVVGLTHFVWKRHRHEQKMRMTKEEARRERKEDEGDPLVKRRMRQKAHELVNLNRLIEAVPQADLVVVNPTHYAVALRYRPNEGAPLVVAKGRDYRALKIRELAREYGLPIVPNPPLARALHSQVDVGRPIPDAFFRAVSEVLAFVMRQRGMAEWRPLGRVEPSKRA